jgi:putative flippase GtrA
MMISKIISSLRGELGRFLLVGGIAVILDGLFYIGLAHFYKCDPIWAKRISFAIGGMWAFGMNKFYTFRKKEIKIREPFYFGLVYLTGWILNSCIHDFILNVWSLKIMAFLCATLVSTVNNYLGLKIIVFGTKRS